MDNRIKLTIDNFIESVGNFGASLGISKVVAQLYALLYIWPEPLSLDDMCELLKISKGNASMNIRYLEQWNAVKKTWQKGSRKDYYEVNPYIEKIVFNRLKEGLERRINDFMQNIEKIEENLQAIEKNSKNNEIAKIFKERLKKIKDINKKINRFFSIIKPFIG
ncbi:MAG: ABC-three component system protein [Endomicrobiia bacterium]